MVRDRDSRAELVATMARLLRDQGYTATGLAQVLAASGVSNGSLYHHFPGGLEQLAEAALEASGDAVAEVLREALSGAPNTGAGLAQFLDIAAQPGAGAACPGCPIAPTALESPLISARLRAAAARSFGGWEAQIAQSLRDDGMPEDAVPQAASAALALIEGALLLAKVSGETEPLTHAKRAIAPMLTESAVAGDGVLRTTR